MTPSDPAIPDIALPSDWRVDYGPIHAPMHAYFRDQYKAREFASHHCVDGVAARIVPLFERMGGA